MSQYKQLPCLDDFEVYRPSSAAMKAANRRHKKMPETLTRIEIKVSWICAIIAAGIMLETLPFKFSGSPESIYIFQKMHTEPFMRWVQGFWELCASICLLTPRVRWMGGILTTGAMGAAILSHLTWLGIVVLGDHGLLFCMAVTSFTCGFTILILHRHQIPFVTPISYW